MHSIAPPSQRYPIYGQPQPQLFSQPPLHRIAPPQLRDASLSVARSGRSLEATPSASSSTKNGLPRRLQHRQLDNPPPPQAGADAILGRRNKLSGQVPPKSSLTGDQPLSRRHTPNSNPDPVEKGTAPLDKSPSVLNRSSTSLATVEESDSWGQQIHGKKNVAFPLGLGGPTRNKLRKSHSRSDLARDMALDRSHLDPHTQRRLTPDSSSSITRNSTNTSSSLLGQQLTASQQVVSQKEHMLQQQSLEGLERVQLYRQQQQQPSQPLLSHQPRPQRTPSFLSTPQTEVNADGVRRSTSSISSAEDRFRQQHHSHSPGNIGKSLDDNPNRPKQHLSLVRNEPLGEYLMQDSFPRYPLTSQGRQSSGGSSGTAVTHNKSLANQDRNPSINDYNAESVTLEKQPQLPSTLNARNIDNKEGILLSNQSHMERNTSHCERCAQMEMALLSLQADMEYIRTLELQREFECKDGDNRNTHRPSKPERMDSSHSVTSAGSRGSRGSSRLHWQNGDNSIGSINSKRTQTKGNRFLASRTGMYLRDASRRLSELSTRHKRQVKQSTHERAYWQNDMHLKLEKFAMMCKNLNEESAKRSNELKETRAQLEAMTSERNALAGRVTTLGARVKLYEEEIMEPSRLRDEWTKEKLGLLDFVENAIKKRDATINDLFPRLELAVETIENERKQQRMRRQVIFPSSSRQSPSAQTRSEKKDTCDGSNCSESFSPNGIPDTSICLTADYLERIHKPKEEARKAQIVLQAAMDQNSVKKNEMQLRFNAIERELAEARSAIRNLNDSQKSTMALEMEERGMLIRSISSTTSLESASKVL